MLQPKLYDKIEFGFDMATMIANTIIIERELDFARTVDNKSAVEVEILELQYTTSLFDLALQQIGYFTDFGLKLRYAAPIYYAIYLANDAAKVYAEFLDFDNNFGGTSNSSIIQQY